MGSGRSRAAQLPAIFTALAASGAFGAACLDVAEGGSNSCLNIVDAPSGASLLQHHRSRHLASLPAESASNANINAILDPGQIFLDVQDHGCNIGSSCTAGGIPPSRGACVTLLSGAQPNECWDICNMEHLPEDYSTGDAQFEAKLAQAVKSVRAGAYPHMRCPALSTLDSQTFQAKAITDDAPAPDVSEGGCCFSFGYSAEMEPTGLSTENATTRELCSEPAADLVGAKTGFTSGSCPSTAIEADAMMTGVEKIEAPSQAPAQGELMEAADIIMVMEGIRGAEKAAEKARLLTSAAKMESEALSNAGTEEDLAVAEVMKLAAASEADAAEKAKKVSEDLKQLSEKRFAKAKAEGPTTEVDPVDPEAPSKADDAPLDAEVVAIEPNDADVVVASDSGETAVNASESKDTLVVKKNQELKEVAEKTTKAREEVEHFEEAIKESKALNVSSSITESLVGSAAASMKEMKEDEEAELIAEQALQAAKAQTVEAQAAVDAEKAQLGEDSNADAKKELAPTAAVGAKEVQTAECRWLPALQCVREFEYAGKLYAGCADVDSSTPWCSHTARYAGNYSKCTSTCDAPATNGTGSDSSEVSAGSNGSNRSIIQAGSKKDLERWGKGAIDNLTAGAGTQA